MFCVNITVTLNDDGILITHILIFYFHKSYLKIVICSLCTVYKITFVNFISCGQQNGTSYL